MKIVIKLNYMNKADKIIQLFQIKVQLVKKCNASTQKSPTVELPILHFTSFLQENNIK